MSEAQGEESVGMIVSYRSVDGRPVPSRVSVIGPSVVRTVDGELWRSHKGSNYNARKLAYLSGFDRDQVKRVRQFAAIHHKETGFEGREVTEQVAGMPLFMRFEAELFDGQLLKGRGLRAPHPFMSTFIDLAPIRAKPRRTNDAPQTDFSAEGDHTPYVVRKRLSSKTQAEAFRKFLEDAGNSSGLFKSISVKQYGSGALAPFEIRIALGQTSLSLNNVGYGVSQALPVLVEIFVRPKRTAFAIQQPEVHLHPRAQATFGDLIAELARVDEKFFVVETHSDFTIDRFRLNVRKNGAIPSQILFFERRGERNVTTAIPIDVDGKLSDDQPDSYREFFYNESLDLLS